MRVIIKSANEGSVNFSPFSRNLLGGPLSYAEPAISLFLFILLQDSTPKVEL